MRQKLSLDKTWTECLRMWKWVAGQIKKDSLPLFDVKDLKEKWLNTHGYKNKSISRDCFFCEYADHKHGCSTSCPALEIDEKEWEVDGCCNYRWHYEHKPLAFYAKLVELNKIRLSHKRQSQAKKRKK